MINHGAVQKSLGQVTLSGLRRPDYKVIVELHPDAKGPRASPGSYSVRDILTKMSGAGKIRLWQCIIQNRNGGYDGYFPGTDPMVCVLARRSSPSSWRDRFAISPMKTK